MLEGKQIIDKLYGEADLFVHHMRKKEYPQATCCYDTARNVAVFLELEEKKGRNVAALKARLIALLEKFDLPDEHKNLAEEKR